MAKATKKTATKKQTLTKKAAKKSAPKKAAPKRQGVAGANLIEEVSVVSYEVKFFGGAGEIQFVGENLDRSSTADDQFDVSQSKTKQRTDVGGNAPSSANGRIEVQVSHNGTILSKFSENVFTGLFNSVILYTVK